MARSRLSVLVVDDDVVAAEAVSRSLRRFDAGLPVLTAENGREALGILREAQRHPLTWGPMVVLLDLHMPRLDGFQFLHDLRADPRLRGTVVIVLTDSDDDLDRSRAFKEAISGYLLKSDVGAKFDQLVALIAGCGAAAGAR